MTGLDRLARELSAGAERLTETRAMLDRYDTGPLDRLAAAPGRLGEVGRRLAAQLAAAAQARDEELGTAAAGLDTLADAVRRAAGHYAETEDRARHGLGRSHDGER